MRTLVTGGAGFIGSAVIRHAIGNLGWTILNVDKLTYAGNLTSLRHRRDQAGKRTRLAGGRDIRDRHPQDGPVVPRERLVVETDSPGQILRPTFEKQVIGGEAYERHHSGGRGRHAIASGDAGDQQTDSAGLRQAVPLDTPFWSPPALSRMRSIPEGAGNRPPGNIINLLVHFKQRSLARQNSASRQTSVGIPL